MNPRKTIKGALMVLAAGGLLLAACQNQIVARREMQPGLSPAQVQGLLGEPARTQDFLLPEVPFFGPQESLTGLIPAGALVEEWVYVQGDEELYVWFHCDQGEVGEDCSLIKTASYPVGAVY